MKIPVSISLFALFASAILIIYLSRQDDKASRGIKANSYLTFNRSKPAEANAIMNYWRNDTEVDAKNHILNIIRADYIFMAIYSIYLCLLISYLKRNRAAGRPWVKKLLSVAMVAILLGTAIDALQDFIIYRYLVSNSTVGDMRYYTNPKWWSIKLGVLIILIALVPTIPRREMVSRCIRFTSLLLKSLWLFFPGILFLLLPIFCFWMLGQGKDLVVAFIDNKSPQGDRFTWQNIFRVLFFLAIAFWVYVSWYSSRIIAYVKTMKQIDLQVAAGVDRKKAEMAFKKGLSYFEISKKFLDAFPRLIGNSCFLILELAILQAPILVDPLSSGEAWILFFIALIATWYIDKWVYRKQGQYIVKNRTSIQTLYSPAFKITWWCFIGLVLVTSFFKMSFISKGNGPLWTLFLLLIIFHSLFIYFVNLRRYQLRLYTPKKTPEKKRLLERTMDHFCIPLSETGYYRWFLVVCVAGLSCYVLSIKQLWFARDLTPFPLVILCLTALLILGNITTAISVRHRFNAHVLVFLAAMVIGNCEMHQVRVKDKDEVNNDYSKRPNLKKYLAAWLNRDLGPDSSYYDVYFVMANGGASRSGYWTAAVLGRLEDESIKRNPGDRFSSHIFCLSGTSGGAVGLATFFSLLSIKDTLPHPWYAASGMNYLRKDYFSYTIARMLGPDYLKYLLPFPAMDRAAALEESMELSAIKSDTTYRVPFDSIFSYFKAMTNGSVQLPLLFINSTRMQDGNPAVVTNMNISADTADNPTPIFNKRVDVAGLLAPTPHKDFSMATASILGARFPYLSPAGEIDNQYFVDGGYFDNSGAGVVQELIRGIIKEGIKDTTGILMKKIKKLRFNILHIVNSPVINDTSKFKKVAPIKNDLLSPVLTIVGAYDMQTTVNDVRLRNYIDDLKSKIYDSLHATYQQVSLYKTEEEWKKDTVLNRRFKTEPSYAMNWFMSDTTAKRINVRLDSNEVLRKLILKK